MWRGYIFGFQFGLYFSSPFLSGEEYLHLPKEYKEGLETKAKRVER